MSRFRSLWQASISATKRAFAWNFEDFMPPSENIIFSFNSKDELKRWHLYSDSEYGGLSSASLEIKEGDSGLNGATSYSEMRMRRTVDNLSTFILLAGHFNFSKVKSIFSCIGIFSGNLSLDMAEGSPWRMKRSGFCGMRSKKFNGFIDLEAYDTIIMKLLGDGRSYISTIYTDNWINSPGKEEDNSWQAFVFSPKDEWHEVKIPLERYLPTWRGNVIDVKLEMNPARIVGMSLSVNAGGGVPGAKSGPGEFKLEIDYIKALRT